MALRDEAMVNFGGPWLRHPFVWDLETTPMVPNGVHSPELLAWACLACGGVARAKWRPDEGATIFFSFTQKGNEEAMLRIAFKVKGKIRRAKQTVDNMLGWFSPTIMAAFQARMHQLGLELDSTGLARRGAKNVQHLEMLTVWRDIAYYRSFKCPVWDTVNRVYHVRSFNPGGPESTWPPSNEHLEAGPQ